MRIKNLLVMFFVSLVLILASFSCAPIAVKPDKPAVVSVEPDESATIVEEKVDIYVDLAEKFIKSIDNRDAALAAEVTGLSKGDFAQRFAMAMSLAAEMAMMNDGVELADIRARGEVAVIDREESKVYMVCDEIWLGYKGINPDGSKFKMSLRMENKTILTIDKANKIITGIHITVTNTPEWKEGWEGYKER